MFNIGDRVHNISLFSVNTPVSGGFPWNREDTATVVEYHPHGTQWHTHIYTTPIYMIRYDRTWMTEEAYNNYFNPVYPAHESQLVKVEDFGK